LNLERIEPKECFKGLKGISGSKLYTLTPIAPILKMNKNDKRFISSYEVIKDLDYSINIAAIDWKDFEHLVREIFEKEFSQNGGEVKVTQSSRDEGVDAIAFDPDSIRGGKIVIQAKRYTNVVGVSAVRDLFGTVMNEGATKGILVTTADYGSDIDIAIDDAVISEAEWKKGDNILGFTGIDPICVAMLPVEQHFAEKIHAYSYPREKRHFSRIRDLVDLVLIIEQGLPDKKLVISAIKATFKLRNTHDMPKLLEIPPDILEDSYAKMAQDCGITKKEMAEAFSLLQEYWAGLRK